MDRRYQVTITILFDAETDEKAEAIADRIDAFVEHGSFSDGLSAADVDPVWTYASGAEPTIVETIELRETAKQRSNRFVECGECGHYHRSDFSGDCRTDSERYCADEIPNGSEIVDLEPIEDGHEQPSCAKPEPRS